MSTHPPLHQRQTRPASTNHPQPDRSAASELAPATFDRRRTDRLENLIDEFNAAFPSSE